MLRAVLLDVDGTLIDSNDAHAHAWVEALSEAGIDVPFVRIRRLIGKGGDKVLAEVAALDAESDLGERIAKRRQEIFLARHLQRCVPLLGARALLERFKHERLGLVVATSAQHDELRPLLEHAGVADLIAAAATSSEAERSKPDPDIVHAALGRAGVAPGEALMLGDTPYDVEAATVAGVGIVALRSGGWSDADLAGALAIYDDPAALLAVYALSPFAAAGSSRDFV